ncbi:MAG TPA: DUF481 domain-containing protein [Gaiellaceae bacterium]|jgi:hypothetical protein|nr:DUF481 domain-containing protein [Gaiellaceae bacterium]
MIQSLAFASVLALAATAARAQTSPVAATPDAALAGRLQAVAALPPRAARAALVAASDAPSRELLAALDRIELRAPLLARLAPSDPDGSLRESFRILSAALDAARRGDAALTKIGDKSLEPLPAGPGDPAEEGWEHRTEVFAGAASAGGRRYPATGLAHESEWTKGPWKVELGARGLISPNGDGFPLDGDLEATASRRIAKTPFSLFAGTELHRDDLMGISYDVSAHGGVETALLETKRQTLAFDLGLGSGAERHMNGESERHPIILTSVEYELKLSARAAFSAEFELEQNPRVRGDYELKSVNAVVWDLSKTLAVRAACTLLRRGEPVPGYAAGRSETTIGLVIH